MAPQVRLPTVEQVATFRTYKRARTAASSLFAIVATLLFTAAPAQGITYADREAKSTEGRFAVAIYESTQPGRMRPIGPVCTGALLNERVIVTAAHCVDKVGPENLLVGQPGAKADADGKLVAVDAVVIHGSYRRGSSSDDAGIYDIALLHLAAPMAGERVELPSATVLKKATTSELQMYGYGLNEKGVPSRTLKLALVKDMSAAVRANPPSYRYDLANLIPAGGYRTNVRRYAGACTGDSGGPLVLKDKGKSYLVGVTSYVFADKSGACDSTFASSFLRVSSKTSWIQQSQKAVTAAALKAELNYSGSDPLGDGNKGRIADLTAVRTKVSATSVLIEADIMPMGATSKLNSDISFDTDGDRAADMKAFGASGTVTGSSGELRCQGQFSSDRKTLRWILPRTCFKGSSLSFTLIASEEHSTGVGTDSVGLTNLPLPQR